MKFQLAKVAFLVAALGVTVSAADAQTRAKTTRKSTSTAKKSTTKKTNTQVADANLNAIPKDTVPVVLTQRKDPLLIDTPRKSLRNDASVERNLVKDRTPLAYENIREDDAWYRERVWREIDIREKMNQSFSYKANEDNGNQRFITILLNAIRTGEVTAFDPSVDDRFTAPMTAAKIGEMIAGKCDTIPVIDWAKDPTGSKGITKDSVVCREFNPDDIVKFRIKEEWVFDKESSRMYARILGIAPMKTYIDDATGAVINAATITIKNVDTGVTRSLTTNDQGRYTATDLIVGTYEAEARASGFQTTIQRAIPVTVGSQRVVDFSMQVGQAQQTITVEAEAVAVSLGSSEKAGTLSAAARVEARRSAPAPATALAICAEAAIKANCGFTGGAVIAAMNERASELAPVSWDGS